MDGSRKRQHSPTAEENSVDQDAGTSSACASSSSYSSLILPDDWVCNAELITLTLPGANIQVFRFLQTRQYRADFKREHFIPKQSGDLYRMAAGDESDVIDSLCHGGHAINLNSILRDGFTPQPITDDSIFSLDAFHVYHKQECHVKVHYSPNVVWFGAIHASEAENPNCYGSFAFTMPLADIVAQRCRRCYNDELTGTGDVNESHNGYHFFYESIYEVVREAESRILITKRCEPPTALSLLYHPGNPGGGWFYDSATATKRHFKAASIHTINGLRKKHTLAFMLHVEDTLLCDQRFTIHVPLEHNWKEVSTYGQGRKWWECRKKAQFYITAKRNVPYGKWRWRSQQYQKPDGPPICPDEYQLFGGDNDDADDDQDYGAKRDCLAMTLFAIHFLADSPAKLAPSIRDFVYSLSDTATDLTRESIAEGQSVEAYLTDVRNRFDHNDINSKLAHVAGSATDAKSNLYCAMEPLVHKLQDWFGIVYDENETEEAKLIRERDKGLIMDYIRTRCCATAATNDNSSEAD